MRILFVIAVSCSLGACGFTTYGDYARHAIRVKGAQASDAGLSNAEWYMCNATTSGAISRRYRPNPQVLEAWQKLCAFNRLQNIPTD